MQTYGFAPLTRWCCDLRKCVYNKNKEFNRVMVYVMMPSSNTL